MEVRKDTDLKDEYLGLKLYKDKNILKVLDYMTLNCNNPKYLKITFLK